MKKTLHLNLHKKWFDMILSGEKTEEYRDPENIYWIKRIVDKDLFRSAEDFNKWFLNMPKYVTLDHVLNQFETITFSNGFSKTRDQFIIEYKGVEIKEGNPKWGAEAGKQYFVLKLGDIIS